MAITKGRIENKTESVTESGCWIWTGTTTVRGYGQLIDNNKKIYAHRASYMAFKGSIPSGMLVCHSCDNVYCVNPSHLFLGTQKDNLNDMAKKGRSTHGSKNAMAKLNEVDIKLIRSLAKVGMKIKLISKVFSVSVSNVNAIISKRRWNHV